MSIASSTLRCAGAAALGLGTLLGGTTLAAAEPGPEQFSEHVIALPEVVVTDRRELPPLESWRYAQCDGIEVLSSASAGETRRLVDDLQQFRQMLEVVWPIPRRPNAELAIILCGRAGEFESFSPPSGTDDPRVGRASLHLPGGRQSAIVVDVKTRVLQVDVLDSNPKGVDTSQLRVDQAQQLRREYVRFLLAGDERRLPAWFEEGMAQLAMNIKATGRSIAVGKIEEANAISAEAALYAMDQEIAAMQLHGGSHRMVRREGGGGASDFSPPPADERDFTAALSDRPLLPLERFLAVPRGAPETQNPLGSNRWMKQAHAFVHLGLFGEGGRWRKPFAEFLRRSLREPLSETMFKECFHRSYHEMDDVLQEYVRFTWYNAVVFKAKDAAALPKLTPIDVRDATPSEIGCIKAGAKRLAGHTAAARLDALAPYARGERDRRLLATLGLVEHASGQDDRARKFLAAAVAAKCDVPEAYLELARFLYADAAAAPGAPDRQRFSADQIAGITRLLLTARKLDPAMAAVYDTLADTLARSGVPLQERDVVPLIEGAQRFPKHFRLIYSTAGLCAEAGLTKVAGTLADHGIKYAPDAAMREQFNQLKARLPKPAEK